MEVVQYAPPADFPYVRLTVRQVETLYVIEEFTARHGYAPSCREIAENLSPSVTVTAVWAKLKALQQAEILALAYGVRRSVHLTPKGKAILEQVARVVSRRGAALPLEHTGTLAEPKPITRPFVANARHVATLQAIETLTDRHGYPPSRKDLAELFNITNEAVACRVRCLHRRKLLSYTAGVGRSIRLTPEGKALGAQALA